MSPPDFTTLRQGGPGCPSDLSLDRLHAGELAKEAAQQIEQHLAGCADCTARMSERRAGFDAVDGVDPRAMLARIRTGLDQPPPLHRRLLRYFAPLAVAATAAVVFVLVRPEVETPGTRMKGSPALHVFRLAGDHAEEMVSGGAFTPGDRIRFAVDLPQEGQVMVLGVESSGALYTAWPREPEQRTHLSAGNAIELPGAVSLDAQPGRETLYLVHCPDSSAPPRCESTGPGTAPSCPKGCISTPFIMDKQGLRP
ncbi:zf-HC2 domain-containing protein [Pyxidicoccus parkwayensis]|uniref:Zf-HC2 domain-containing protein n=1 Tax=Pyxidicoccus parkwayensis TaxID=2813578 RepID=A0ABX7P6L2_9BACT|nr:zf-HC2 domain-containing protein [Pyxidicoccus parkwaysis]QSQ26108.1 zf-HC2 domain-containing protein [Pyxidicoccus parkwaysis]